MYVKESPPAPREISLFPRITAREITRTHNTHVPTLTCNNYKMFFFVSRKRNTEILVQPTKEDVLLMGSLTICATLGALLSAALCAPIHTQCY